MLFRSAAFRHDVRAYYHYFAWFETRGSKLNTPVRIVLGDNDGLTCHRRDTTGWSKVTGMFIGTDTLKEANHYFIRTHGDELAALLTGCLPGKY